MHLRSSSDRGAQPVAGQGETGKARVVEQSVNHRQDRVSRRSSVTAQGGTEQTSPITPQHWSPRQAGIWNPFRSRNRATMMASQQPAIPGSTMNNPIMARTTGYENASPPGSRVRRRQISGAMRKTNAHEASRADSTIFHCSTVRHGIGRASRKAVSGFETDWCI